MSLVSKILAFLLDVFGVPFGFVVFALVPAIFLSIPAWKMSKKFRCFFRWDIGLPIYGMIFWLLCMNLFRLGNLKGDTLVNLYIEPLAVGLCSVLLSYLKPLVFCRICKSQKLLFFINLVLLCAFIILMRLFIPIFLD